MVYYYEIIYVRCSGSRSDLRKLVSGFDDLFRKRESSLVYIVIVRMNEGNSL